MTEFKLKGDYIELCKLLKFLGIGETGGEAKEIVSEGQVKVDGEVELRRRCKIKAGQIVVCGEHEIKVV